MPARHLPVLLALLLTGTGAAAIPRSVTLPNVGHEYQGPDNCAPVTALTVLGYYGTRVSQRQAAAAMKDYVGDPQVSSLELAAYLGRFGLRSVIRYAGDVERLRELVAQGFPVVVQQRLKPGSNVAHFRTVYGYSAGRFLVSDPIRGPSLQLSDAQMVDLWRYYNGEYLVAYRPDQEAQVKRVLGTDFDVSANWKHAREHGLQDVKARPGDPYAWWGLAKANLRLGDASAASGQFERAVSLGVPTLYYLYRQEAFEAWIKTGQFTDILTLTRRALKLYPNSKELLSFQARASRKESQ